MELFNFFCAREEAWGGVPKDPVFAALGQLRSLSALRGAAKTYTLACGTSQGEVDGVFQVPVALPFGMMRRFEMLLAAESEEAQVEVDVVFTGAVAADRIWVHVNHLPLGHARSIAPLAGATGDIRVATFVLPAKALRDGRNKVMVRNEANTAMTVVSIDVRVRH